MSAPSRITGDDFLRLIRETIPGSAASDLRVEELVYGRAVVRLRGDPSQVRAGGTLSGPVIMTLADTALYAVVLSVVGLEPQAVTTDLSFHFLRRPAVRDLVAEARILKLGRRLAVGDVVIRSEGSDDAVAHGVGSYALPNRA